MASIQLPTSRSFVRSEARDNCETPAVAYAHLAPVLSAIARVLQRTTASLRIYDPYYCAGSCVTRLSDVGFPCVYNRDEDFYDVVEGRTLAPPHDVTVTNPPFSGNHIQRALEWVARDPAVPWAMLIPSFTSRKRHARLTLQRFRQTLSGSDADGAASDACIVYIGPTLSPYAFDVPAGSRPHEPLPLAAEGTGGRATVRAGSFECIWFVGLGSHARPVLHALGIRAAALAQSAVSVPGTDGGAVISASIEALPQLAPAGRITPAERRWRRKLSLMTPQQRASLTTVRVDVARGRVSEATASGAVRHFSRMLRAGATISRPTDRRRVHESAHLPDPFSPHVSANNPARGTPTIAACDVKR